MNIKRGAPGISLPISVIEFTGEIYTVEYLVTFYYINFSCHITVRASRRRAKVVIEFIGRPFSQFRISMPVMPSSISASVCAAGGHRLFKWNLPVFEVNLLQNEIISFWFTSILQNPRDRCRYLALCTDFGSCLWLQMILLWCNIKFYKEEAENKNLCSIIVQKKRKKIHKQTLKTFEKRQGIKC